MCLCVVCACVVRVLCGVCVCVVCVRVLCVCCAVCACALCVCVVCACVVRRVRVCCVCAVLLCVVCVVWVVGECRVCVRTHMSVVGLDFDRLHLRYREEATRTCGKRRRSPAALEGRGPLDRRRPRLTTEDGRRTTGGRA